MRKDAGFTLVELFVTMAIMLIMAAFAVPMFADWQHNFRLKNATQELFSNFQRAKLTAVKRNMVCTITFNQSIDGKRYDYVVYVDKDSNMVYDPDEEVIAKVLWEEDYERSVFLDQDGGITFSQNSENLPSVGFRSDGIPKSNGNPNGRVCLENVKGRKTEVVLSRTGNVRIVSK